MPEEAKPKILAGDVAVTATLVENSKYNLPDVLLIEPLTDCHAAAPLGVTVSPPLLNVIALAVASAADHTEVGGGATPPPEPPQPLMVIGVAPIAAGGGAKNPAIQTAVAPATGA